MLFHLEDEETWVEGTVVGCRLCDWVQDFDKPIQAFIAAEDHICGFW